jgi:hypothetical protein
MFLTLHGLQSPRFWNIENTDYPPSRKDNARNISHRNIRNRLELHKALTDAGIPPRNLSEEFLEIFGYMEKSAQNEFIESYRQIKTQVNKDGNSWSCVNLQNAAGQCTEFPKPNWLDSTRTERPCFFGVEDVTIDTGTHLNTTDIPPRVSSSPIESRSIPIRTGNPIKSSTSMKQTPRPILDHDAVLVKRSTGEKTSPLVTDQSTIASSMHSTKMIKVDMIYAKFLASSYKLPLTTRQIDENIVEIPELELDEAQEYIRAIQAKEVVQAKSGRWSVRFRKPPVVAIEPKVYHRDFLNKSLASEKPADIRGSFGRGKRTLRKSLSKIFETIRSNRGSPSLRLSLPAMADASIDTTPDYKCLNKASLPSESRSKGHKSRKGVSIGSNF